MKLYNRKVQANIYLPSEIVTAILIIICFVACSEIYNLPFYFVIFRPGRVQTMDRTEYYLTNRQRINNLQVSHKPIATYIAFC